MTFPKASRPLLMAIPSFMRSPCAAVRLSLSDPAKSTMLNLLVTTTKPLSATLSPTCIEFGRVRPGLCVDMKLLGGGPGRDPDGVADRPDGVCDRPMLEKPIVEFRVGVFCEMG